MTALVCELCGHQARTSQGLAGHRQFKHQLAEQFPKPSELAQLAETLKSREAELTWSIELLEKRNAETELAIAQLEGKGAELEREVTELRRIRDNLQQVEIPQLAQRFRQGLMALGWIPPSIVKPDTVLWGELAKGIWRALAKG